MSGRVVNPFVGANILISQSNLGWYRGSEKGKAGWEDDLNKKFAGIAESYGIAWDEDPFLG